jgi:hypothetical protein
MLHYFLLHPASDTATARACPVNHLICCCTPHPVVPATSWPYSACCPLLRRRSTMFPTPVASLLLLLEGGSASCGPVESRETPRATPPTMTRAKGAQRTPGRRRGAESPPSAPLPLRRRTTTFANVQFHMRATTEDMLVVTDGQSHSNDTAGATLIELLLPAVHRCWPPSRTTRTGSSPYEGACSGTHARSMLHVAMV